MESRALLNSQFLVSQMEEAIASLCWCALMVLEGLARRANKCTFPFIRMIGSLLAQLFFAHPTSDIP